MCIICRTDISRSAVMRHLAREDSSYEFWTKERLFILLVSASGFHGSDLIQTSIKRIADYRDHCIKQEKMDRMNCMNSILETIRHFRVPVENRFMLKVFAFIVLPLLDQCHAPPSIETYDSSIEYSVATIVSICIAASGFYGLDSRNEALTFLQQHAMLKQESLSTFVCLLSDNCIEPGDVDGLHRAAVIASYIYTLNTSSSNGSLEEHKTCD